MTCSFHNQCRPPVVGFRVFTLLEVVLQHQAMLHCTSPLLILCTTNSSSQGRVSKGCLLLQSCGHCLLQLLLFRACLLLHLLLLFHSSCLDCFCLFFSILDVLGFLQELGRFVQRLQLLVLHLLEVCGLQPCLLRSLRGCIDLLASRHLQPAWNLIAPAYDAVCSVLLELHGVLHKLSQLLFISKGCDLQGCIELQPCLHDRLLLLLQG